MLRRHLAANVSRALRARIGRCVGRDPADRAIVTALGERRFADPEAVVVIVADPEVRGRVVAWIRRFPYGTVRVVAPEAAPEWRLERYGAVHYVDKKMQAVNHRLKLIGPADVIIDLHSPTPEVQLARWRRLFLHLKPGGVYVVDPIAEGARTFNRRYAAWLSGVLGNADPERPGGTEARELSHAVERVDVSRDLVIIEKRGRHFLKLRDAEANQILGSRERALGVTLLAERPAGTLQSRARVTSCESTTPIDGLEPVLPYPKLHLRHYTGDIAFTSHSLLYTGSTILPDSFRHHLERRGGWGNTLMINASNDFARIPGHLRPRQHVSGTYFHLDSANSGHFGHLMTEVISRLWGWDEAKRAIPDLKVIFRIRHANERIPQLERRVFRAYGIAPEDIVWTDQPVLLKSVVAATPMWHNREPHYVHPDMQLIWDRIGDALVDETAPHYRKIFVSRSDEHPGHRCRNARDVEALFAEHGFEILYPERLDLGVQAGIFSAAEVIAGFGGSGLFNMMFARNVKKVIQLAHEGYFARETHLFTSLLGADTHYFWSVPDFVDPHDKYSKQSFYSSWEFDFGRNGADLRALLADL